MAHETGRAEGDSVLLPPDGGGTNRRPRREFLGAVFVLGVAGAFVVQALRMPFHNQTWEWYTSPNIFPLAMAVCLALCAASLAVRGLVGWRRDHQRIGPIRWAASARTWGLGRFVAGVAMIALFVFLLGKVNFYVLAPGSIIAFGLGFRSDPLPKALKSALIAAAFIVVFLYLVSRIFGIVFP